MPNSLSSDLLLALPELIVAGAALVLLMVGVFAGRNAVASVLWLAVLALVAAGLSILFLERPPGTAFGGLFVVEAFGDFMKLLVLLGAALTVALSLHFIRREEMGSSSIRSCCSSRPPAC